HGIQQDLTKKIYDHGPWYYEMQELGFNYRLTDFQAALGLSQLKRANQGMDRRKEIANKYFQTFAGKSFIKGQSGIVPGHAYHLYVVELERRTELLNHLRESNIFSQIHYIPAHLMPYYRQLGWKEGDFPYSERYYSQCLSLPIYPTLTSEEQDYVIKTILNFYNV
ncbi:MAG: DegT/DnrJ/EryC1/StrS family aminotransferase, partial [Phormidesmis sp. FL-bin-119]|nr:DegT/DnrJ/EryC1/StrS family aminotransferase [Pedobacter sp.]